MNRSPQRTWKKTLFLKNAKWKKGGGSHELGHLKTQTDLRRKDFGKP